MTRQIYFIQAASGPVKIGLAQDPERWLTTMQLYNHEKLALLATQPEANWRDEELLHARFWPLRIHDGWFRHEPELAAYITRFNGVPPSKSEIHLRYDEHPKCLLCEQPFDGVVGKDFFCSAKHKAIAIAPLRRARVPLVTLALAEKCEECGFNIHNPMTVWRCPRCNHRNDRGYLLVGGE